VTFEEWVAAAPAELTNDPLWRMEVYRLAVFAADLAWSDVSHLSRDRRTWGLADQLYRSVGSIGANVAEGYSHQSSKDQARFYEYALGSAREARGWYYQGRHILSEEVASHRMKLLTAITRSLLTIIPAERGYKLREEPESYDASPVALLNDPPLP